MEKVHEKDGPVRVRTGPPNQNLSCRCARRASHLFDGKLGRYISIIADAYLHIR